MKVKLGGEIKNYPAVWLKDDVVKFIDQRALPHEFTIFEARSYQDVAEAINTMIVRGAPAIGVAAAYGMALAARQPDASLESASEVLFATRPTAYDLDFALNYMKDACGTESVSAEKAAEAARSYADKIIERCKKIGENGEGLIKDGMNILTHCNAGALATVEYGTALAPMRLAAGKGKKFFVYVDETRPRLQGAKLTAWELNNEDIPCAVIADNAAGYYMKNKDIDIVITGADRIAALGDAANKIGTYEKAVLAKENGIPFYIAAPVSTFDADIQKGEDIPIENRDPEEVLELDGRKITPEGVDAKNPAFDVTPAKYIEGFITEIGILKPDQLKDTIFSKKISF
ncbi:MAG: S-methyl-5-thioribose-1-phosphate isomerase [Thermoplasmata archaeon]|nr:MAG: S-methyl-5-thioribose-1-phosphate isomerase [Thermoplasmata archaeon]